MGLLEKYRVESAWVGGERRQHSTAVWRRSLTASVIGHSNSGFGFPNVVSGRTRGGGFGKGS